MKKLYIAGKYRGDIDANIAVARKVAIELWEAGHAALCPHLNTAHFEVGCNIPEEQYIEGDLLWLACADAIVMLPDWERSDGAYTEWRFARDHGIPRYYWPDYPEVRDGVEGTF